MFSDVYEIGPLRLEVRERRLVRGGELVELKGKAFELLVVFAEHAGSLLKHQDLLDWVWPDTVVEANNVAHNVSILRKALIGVEGVRIETVPRQGYRLVAPIAAGGDPKGRPGELEQGQEIGFCRATDGTRLAFARCGIGPPLIKVASWLSHVELDWGSPIWSHWLDFLGRGRSLLRYDARGNGLSEWQVEQIDFERFVGDLQTVMDAGGIARAPLLGISQGAAVAAAFAARHPERVSGLVLIGGCARGWRTKGHARLTEQFEALMTLMRNGWGQDNPLFRQIFTTAFFPAASPEETRYFNELQRKTTTPDNAARILGALGELDIRDELPNIVAPTLVLHSRSDAVVPISDGVELATGINGARFVSLDSPNHILLSHEPAWKQFCEETERFLGELSSGPTR